MPDIQTTLCLALLLLALAVPAAVRAEENAPAPAAAEADSAAAADAAAEGADPAAPVPVRPRGPREGVLPDEARQRAQAVRHLGLLERAPGQRAPRANPTGLTSLGTDDGNLLALTTPAAGDILHGRVILLADTPGAALDGRIGRLHRYLAAHGWNVLTLSMPQLPDPDLPVRDRQRHEDALWAAALGAQQGAGDDGQTADAEAADADADEDAAADADAAANADAAAAADAEPTAQADTGADLAAGAADAVAAEGAATDAAAGAPAPAPAVDWSSQLDNRLQAALAALGGGADNRNVLVAQGATGAWALAWARRAAVDVGLVWLEPTPVAELDLGVVAGGDPGKGPVQVLAVAAPGQPLAWLQQRVAGVRVTSLTLVPVPLALQADDDQASRRIRGWLERRVQRPD